jgi:hypothetical protein
MSDNVVEELACRAKLHDKKELTLCLNNLEKGGEEMRDLLHIIG